MDAPDPLPRELSADERRLLARRLSLLLDMPADLALMLCPAPGASLARRIGFSGPPGAGKSSLIDAWARIPLARQRRVGVLAVDPSSPMSNGSLLGDRVRMESAASNPAFYLRSVPSRTLHDGLCPNAAAMLDAFEESGFDDVVLETVGVGQADYSARALVDTFVIVLNVDSGDVVQAMKAGILEMADVLVVNKADLPASQHMARELESIVTLRNHSGWRPPVLQVSAVTGNGIDELDGALQRHAASFDSTATAARLHERRRYCILSALLQTVQSSVAQLEPGQLDRPWPEVLRQLAALLQAGRPAAE